MKQDAADHLKAGGADGVRARLDQDIGGKAKGNGGSPPPPPPGVQPGVGPAAPGPQPATNALEDTLKIFREWLLLDNDIPVLAMLGAVAANKLSGDAIWLGLIAPPSSAKTEMLITLAKIPHTEMVGTLSVAGLLSGTPRRQRTPGAKGGLLNKIGAFGFLVLKDFGSILSLRPDAKLESRWCDGRSTPVPDTAQDALASSSNEPSRAFQKAGGGGLENPQTIPVAARAALENVLGPIFDSAKK